MEPKECKEYSAHCRWKEGADSGPDIYPRANLDLELLSIAHRNDHI